MEMQDKKREWNLKILAGSLTVVNIDGMQDSSSGTLCARFLGFPPLWFEGTPTRRKDGGKAIQFNAGKECAFEVRVMRLQYCI